MSNNKSKGKWQKVSKAKSVNSSNIAKEMRPALTPQARENQMISLAVDLAEKQLREGTASSQVISHFLKLGSSMAQLEQEKLRLENELTKAKTKSVNSSESSEKLYKDAIKAFQKYSGAASSTEEEQTDD